MAATKAKKATSASDKPAKAGSQKRADSPVVFKVPYAKDGFGTMGYVFCLELSHGDNPNIIYLEQALLPDRALVSGPFVRTYMYIISTKVLVPIMYEELTWTDVENRNSKAKAKAPSSIP
jgi:hypothetical protein